MKKDKEGVWAFCGWVFSWISDWDLQPEDEAARGVGGRIWLSVELAHGTCHNGILS